MMEFEKKDVIKRLSEMVRLRLDREAGCHDWDHTCRVLRNAMELAEKCGADSYIVTLAALLHDIARPEETGEKGRCCHACLGATMVPDYLCRAGEERPEIIAHVQSCVRTHRYRNRTGEMPETLEARVLFDADKLDGIGAIGIGRSFHFAGRENARVHNTEAEALAGTSYGREDTAYREFLVKLRQVPLKMLTEPGHRMAESRGRFMEEFFHQLNEECFGES